MAFAKVKRSGNVIGMLLDMDRNSVAFDLDGELQGTCSLADRGQRPVWVLIVVDTPEDKVCLEKVPVSEAPDACIAALKEAM